MARKSRALRAPSADPWRFSQGESVYVRFHDPDSIYTVIDGFLHNRMPHYRLYGPKQEVWVIPQIHLSTTCLREAR